MATKLYTLTIEVDETGEASEQATLLANMLARIEAENASMGQAQCRVTSVVEIEEE